MQHPPEADPGGRYAGRRRGPRSTSAVVLLAVLGVLACCGLTALGVWQIERRAWKLDLIERVEARLAAAPVSAPGPTQWPSLARPADEYRRVLVLGRYLADRETLVQASTRLGAGWWVMTPLRTDAGDVVLINRGFVPPERRDPASRPAPPEGEVEVRGLLRFSEPGGGFLRSNDPSAGRWYSRDVAAIAAAQRLTEVAPYFIDAEAAAPEPAPTSTSTPAEAPPAPHGAAAGPADAEAPVAGLTVVSFRNHHLVYALTWFTLALMTAGALGYLLREEWRLRRPSQRGGALE